MAASMELRAKMSPLTVMSSQCLGYGNKKLSSAATGDTATTATPSPREPPNSTVSTEEVGKYANEDVVVSAVVGPDSTPTGALGTSPSKEAGNISTPPPISIALISKLTQVIHCMWSCCQ